LRFLRERNTRDREEDQLGDATDIAGLSALTMGRIRQRYADFCDGAGL